MAHLCKTQFKLPDKSPRMYNRQPFSLDGHMDLSFSFGDKVMATPIHVKMNAPDQLVLSKGVC